MVLKFSSLKFLQVSGLLNAALCHLEAAPYLPDPLEITNALLEVSLEEGILPQSGGDCGRTAMTE